MYVSKRVCIYVLISVCGSVYQCMLLYVCVDRCVCVYLVGPHNYHLQFTQTSLMSMKCNCVELQIKPHTQTHTNTVQDIKTFYYSYGNRLFQNFFQNYIRFAFFVATVFSLFVVFCVVGNFLIKIYNHKRIYSLNVQLLYGF